jgi:hypothetical protein
MENETEIEKLARMVKSGFDDMQKQFGEVREEMHTGFADLRGEMTAGFAAVDERFAGVDERIAGIDKHMNVLDQKIDHVDAKLDAHREETKDGFTAVHRAIGGLSATLVDHEERLKVLEGE